MVKAISGIIPLEQLKDTIMSKARTFTVDGKDLTIREIAKKYGLNHKTLQQRIKNNGGVLAPMLLEQPKEVSSLVGEKYGRLTINEYSHTDDNGDTCWHAICECGNTKVVKRTNLKMGHTKSCGCLAKELSSARESTHGHSKGGKVSPTYKSWEGMKYRCKFGIGKYGELGVKVCDSWNESFETFLADMGERPDGTSIDRIDSTKGYYKENCRWATDTQQNRNTTKSKHWIIDGVFYDSHNEAAEILNVDPSTILRWCNYGVNNCSSELKYKEVENG